LRQIQGLIDRALLRSVRTSREKARIIKYILAAVHATMYSPEQHREPTTRAIIIVE